MSKRGLVSGKFGADLGESFKKLGKFGGFRGVVVGCGDRIGQANSCWHGVCDRIEAKERIR